MPAASVVVGDKYAGKWPRSRFAQHRISYHAAERTKSQIYAEMLPALTSRAVDLVHDQRLVVQLVRLWRRTAWGGRDSIAIRQAAMTTW